VNNSKSWLENGARFGHFTKGVLYGLIGALALGAALGAGGQVGGGEDAARFVGDQPFGRVLLVLIGIGLAAYSVWRLIEGIKDTEHEGSDGKGLAKRGSSVASGVVNGALAVAIFQMALGESGGGGGARSWVAELLAQPFGAALIGAAGVGIIVAGLVQFYKAYSKTFLEPLRVHAMSAEERRWVTRMGQVGYSARGVVFPLIGIALVKAALNHNPRETKGVGEALLEIASSSYGQAMLTFVAIGFLAFGAFMIASAKYRHVPV
jgi:hypothetical protein